MSYVLTLIANPEKQEILPSEITDCLGNVAMDCLSDGEAYDVLLDNPIDLQPLRDQLSHADIVLQKQEMRRKKLLVADMDSTIVTGETLDDLAEFAGIKEQVSEITRRAMNGEIQFEEALRERVGMLKGLSSDFMEKAMEMVHLMPGAKELVSTMRANGAYCALVSGGFTFFTSRVAAQVGFDFNAGNQLEIIDGVLSGKVIDPILTKDSKLEYLNSFAKKRGLDMAETLAVGDGANDLPMLLEAGLGMAYHAKPSVVEKAHHCLNVANLTGLLFAQGYKKSDFVG